MPDSRLDAVRAWLTRTFAGRLLIAGVVLKLVAWVGLLTQLGPGLFGAIDTLGGLSILVSALAIGYRVYVLARHRLLWRVRRKLILSYVFIGVVPVLLVVIFFTLGGLLFFFNVSAFMLRNHVASVVDGARFLAQAAAPTLDPASPAPQLTSGLVTRQNAAAERFPLVSYALVPSDSRCSSSDASSPAAKVVAGPWSHVDAPQSIPSWVPCSGFASLITYQAEGGTALAARAITWPPGFKSALVVDIPFGDALIREFHDEMGITIESYTIVELADRSDKSTANERRGRLVVGPVNLRLGQQEEPLGWVAFLDYTDGKTGATSPLTVGFRMGPAAVYRYLSGPSFAPLDNYNLGQIFLSRLAVIAFLFLVIQAVALVMGLSLARSITGSVHELFAGTERVRRGDFSHKIAIRSRDQLGELAGSFNSMTASIEGLLVEKAEKERLEQELKIARSIQMSLLPQGPLLMPGVSLSGHCEPAREVGGDYYDFLPLANERIGILIADVAGN